MSSNRMTAAKAANWCSAAATRAAISPVAVSHRALKFQTQRMARHARPKGINASADQSGNDKRVDQGDTVGSSAASARWFDEGSKSAGNGGSERPTRTSRVANHAINRNSSAAPARYIASFLERRPEE